MGAMAFLSLASRLGPTQRAWLAVAGAWLVQFAAVGPINAFGSYQAIYWNAYVPGVSASSLSWIGSLQIFFEFAVAIAGGILLDAGYFKETLLGGSILFTFSYFMLSLVKHGMFVPILLAQGFGMGIGLGFVFLPISGVVAQHFPTSRNLPLGIISTGAGLGGFAMSLLTSKIYADTGLGFGWTVRVAAFIVLGCLLAANLLITEVPASERVVTKSILKADDEKETIDEDGGSAELAEVPLSQARTKEGVRSIISQHRDVSGLLASLKEVLSSGVYLLTVAGGTLFVMGLFYPAYSIESFALAHGIDPGLAGWLLPMSNLSSLIGRTVPAYLADRLGRYGAHIMFSICAVCAGALTIAMPACTSSGPIVAFAILYGLFQGAGPGLFFPTILALGGPRPGFRLGVASVPLSIGALVGAPIASALLGPTASTAGAAAGAGAADVSPNWWGGSAFAAAVWIASALSMGSALFLAKHKERRIRRARGGSGAGAAHRSEQDGGDKDGAVEEARGAATAGAPVEEGTK